MVRIVQLTDLHLRPRLGDARWRRLERLLAELPARVGPIDRLVLTGDLATHGQVRVYAALRTLLSPWMEKLCLVPGNHDHPARLGAAFADRMRERGRFAERVGELRLIGLDSSRPWRVSGRLGAEQLRWLDAQLRDATPSLLFMHHPAYRVGAWWLDKDRLRDGDALTALIQQRGVLGAFCGHVHQPSAGMLGAVPCWTTPSTAYQFKPRALVPRTHAARAGFRLIEVEDGRLDTSVVDC